MLKMAAAWPTRPSLDAEIADFVDALPSSLPPLRTAARTEPTIELVEFAVARLERAGRSEPGHARPGSGATAAADPELLAWGRNLAERLRQRDRLTSVDRLEAALAFAAGELLRRGFERAMTFRNDGTALSVVATDFITADDWAASNHDNASANPVPLVDHLIEAAVMHAQLPAIVERPLDDARAWAPIVAPLQCDGYVVAPVVVGGQAVGTIHADCFFTAMELDAAHRDAIGGLAIDIAKQLARHPATDPAPKVELSVREQQVYDGLAQGLTNQAIADELGLGVETVKTYVSRLLRKLDVPNRSAAAGLAFTRPKPTTSPTTSADTP